MYSYHAWRGGREKQASAAGLREQLCSKHGVKENVLVSAPSVKDLPCGRWGRAFISCCVISGCGR